MSKLKLILQGKSGTIYTESIIALRLEQEAYTPYSQLTISAFGSFDRELLKTVYRVKLLADDKMELHFGTADQLEYVRKNGTTLLRIYSRGLTAMLLQNQLTPGIHSRMSLDRLMTEFYTFPEEITWESSTDASNYIYVKENAAMWDGVTNLTYKLCGRYPFIRGANEIRMHLPTTYQTFYAADASMLASGITTDASKLNSDYYMADADGTYEAFHEVDPEAQARGLVRTRQLALDRQYLYDPQQALIFRRKFAQRGMIRHFVEVNGVTDLRLGDRLSYGSVLDAAPINRIVMTGNAQGVRTRLEAYEDAFYPGV